MKLPSLTQMKLPSLISTIIVAILTAINVAPPNHATAQSPPAENYVRTERRTSASGNTVTTYRYFDSFGRETLNASNEVNTSGKFVYSLKEITPDGYVSRSWLPVVGNIVAKNLSVSEVETLSSSLYNDNYGYDASEYDPLGRPLTKHRSGSLWKQHPAKITYSSNSSGQVKLYRIGTSQNSLPAQNGFYAAGTLRSTTTVDEDGKSITVFTDREGKKILERRGEDNDTYFIYDDFNRLRVVLSPKYQNDPNLGRNAYQYSYDLVGNLISKSVPGCEPVRFWYDRHNRCIAEQDGEMEGANYLFRFTLYDPLGRTALRGLTRTHPDNIKVGFVKFSTDTEGVGGSGYVALTDSCFNIEVESLESVIYYDNYDFLQRGAGDRFATLAHSTTNLTRAKSKITGQLTAVSDGSMIASVNSFDNWGDLSEVQTLTLDGDIEKTQYSYTYTRKPASTIYSLVKANGELVCFESINQYSSSGDILVAVTLKATVNGIVADNCIIRYEYDDLGRRTGVKTPVTGNRGDLAFGYDLHGWPTEISGSLFKQSIHYASGSGSPLFSGDISSVEWKSPKSDRTAYRFSYDGLDRLVKSEYGEDGFSRRVGAYNELLIYDPNGNPTSITRNSLLASGGFGAVDSLTLSYSGNRLVGVIEDAPPVFDADAMDVKRGSTLFSYNHNGSLTADGTRQIHNIEYDYNNNPVCILFENGSETRYVYTVDGQKLRAIHLTAPADGNRLSNLNADTDRFIAIDTIDYRLGGSVIFADGHFKRLLYDDGYLEATNTESNELSQSSTSLSHRFFIKDYLGNNRLVVDIDGNVLQRTDYYPFGTPHFDTESSVAPGLQPYKYNGKELDTAHGLNTFDYGARQYGSTIPRWDRIDPLCEKYYHSSPYTYCLNNPVKHIDPDGRVVDTIWDIGNLLYDLGAAGYSYYNGDYGTAKSHMTDAVADLAATFLPFVPAGASKIAKVGAKAVKSIDKTAEARTGLKNAERVIEGKLFEQSELIKAIDRGDNVSSHTRLVPLNGKGNVKGNRTTVDQLIKKQDGSFKIVETKRSSRTHLSKGQKASQEHVLNGNGIFEVRSNKFGQNLKKNDEILVNEYQRINKYE